MFRVSGIVCMYWCAQDNPIQLGVQENPNRLTHMFVKYCSWPRGERGVFLNLISLYPAHPNSRGLVVPARTCHKLLRDSPPVLGMWKNTTVWQPSGSHGAGNSPAFSTPATPASPLFLSPSLVVKAAGLTLASFGTDLNENMAHPTVRRGAE